MPGPIPSEEIEVANSPAAPAVPSLTPQQQLAAEYELPNSDFDPDDFKPKAAKPPVPVMPATEPVVPAVPPAPKHSKRVLRMAEQFGISQAEIDATEPEALDEALVLMTRQALDDRQRLIAQPARQPAAEVSTETPPAAAKPSTFDLGLTADEEADLHPAISRAFKAMAAKIVELEAMKGTVGTIQQREQRREFESFQQRCDAYFAKHPDIYGPGGYAEQVAGSPALRRRQGTLDSASRDDLKIPFEVRMDRAKQALEYAPLRGAAPVPPAVAPATQPTEAQLITRDSQGRITGRITPEQWNASATARPSHRETPALPPGKERATAYVAEQLKTRDFFAQEGPNGVPMVKDEETLPD